MTELTCKSDLENLQMKCLSGTGFSNVSLRRLGAYVLVASWCSSLLERGKENLRRYPFPTQATVSGHGVEETPD